MSEPNFESETPSAPSPDERNMALLAHIGTLAGYMIGFGHIIVPLVIWLMKRDESDFVRRNALESLNFQISMTIWLAISIALSFILIGIPMLIVLGIVDLVCIIIATMRANEGECYRYPITIRLIN
jgi:hypothetical protein